MATDERSVIAFEHYREGSQRFEYFVLGLSTALCAYAGQTLKPERLGWSPYTVEVGALVLLICSVVVGFKRLETVSLGALINHEILHLRERRGTFAKGLGQGFVDEISGETWTVDVVAREIERMTRALASRNGQMKEIQAKALRLYKWRNWLLGIGFVGLFAAKLLAGYR